MPRCIQHCCALWAVCNIAPKARSFGVQSHLNLANWHCSTKKSISFSHTKRHFNWQIFYCWSQFACFSISFLVFGFSRIQIIVTILSFLLRIFFVFLFHSLAKQKKKYTIIIICFNVQNEPFFMFVQYLSLRPTNMYMQDNRLKNNNWHDENKYMVFISF